MSYKPLEYSSAEEDNVDKLHYDQMAVPKIFDKGINNNKYTPLRILSSGRFSQVLVVRTSEAHAHDVLCLKRLVRPKREAIIDFENELNLYRLCDTNPSVFSHILPLIDFHRSIDCQYFVTELAGPNLNILRSNILQREFSVDSALRLSIQALEGIRELHRRNILHLSIQPSNMVIGFGANTCNLYLVGFGSMRRIDSPKDRCPIHVVHPVYAPLRLRKETSTLDDLESWLYSAMDMFARREIEFMKKKWSAKFREKDYLSINDIKRNMFNDSMFSTYTHIPPMLKKIGKLIQMSETATIETHHDKIIEQLKKYMKEHELDMSALFEWEVSSLQKVILETMLGTHAEKYEGPYAISIKKRLNENEDVEKKDGEKKRFENTLAELDDEEKEEEERFNRMMKLTRSLVYEILASPLDIPEDEEDSVRE